MAQELLDHRHLRRHRALPLAGLAASLGSAHQRGRPGPHQGLGPAKRAELVAVLELARRAWLQQLREREASRLADAVKHHLQLHLAKGHEVFAVLFLDSQHRLLALEELFRGTLTQTSVYPREVVLRALHPRPPPWCWRTITPAAACSPAVPTSSSRKP